MPGGTARACVRTCVHACVRVCVPACVLACVHACVCTCMRAPLCACMCDSSDKKPQRIHQGFSSDTQTTQHAQAAGSSSLCSPGRSPPEPTEPPPFAASTPVSWWTPMSTPSGPAEAFSTLTPGIQAGGGTLRTRSGRSLD